MDIVATDLAPDDCGMTSDKWVEEFVLHPILATKPRDTESNKARKIAREAVIKAIKEKYDIVVNHEQVRKAFNNRKTRLTSKTDANKTGNEPVVLSAAKKKLELFLTGTGEGGGAIVERVQGGFDVGLGSSKETAVRETRSAPPTPSKHAPAVKRLAADICTSPSVKRLKLEQTQLNLMEEQLRYYTRQNSEEEAQYRHLFFNNVLEGF